MGLGPVGGGRRPVAGPAAVWPGSVDLEVDGRGAGPLQIEAKRWTRPMQRVNEGHTLLILLLETEEIEAECEASDDGGAPISGGHGVPVEEC